VLSEATVGGGVSSVRSRSPRRGYPSRYKIGDEHVGKLMASSLTYEIKIYDLGWVSGLNAFGVPYMEYPHLEMCES
jgi:hypothetical protein